MPDDGPRPTPGNPPEQRHESAPAWWGDLERSDLPKDGAQLPIDPELVPLPISSVAPPPPASKLSILLSVAVLIISSITTLIILRALTTRSPLLAGVITFLAVMAASIVFYATRGPRR